MQVKEALSFFHMKQNRDDLSFLSQTEISLRHLQQCDGILVDFYFKDFIIQGELQF